MTTGLTVSAVLAERRAATASPLPAATDRASQAVNAVAADPIRKPSLITTARLETSTSPATALAPSARSQLLILGNRLIRAGSDSYRVTDEIKELVRLHPELGREAIQQVSRSFTYLPMTDWWRPIEFIMDLAVGNGERAVAAYDAMEAPLAMAGRAIAEGNVAMQDKAVTVERMIAERARGFAGRVTTDVAPLLGNTDPLAFDMTENALETLVSLADKHENGADQIYPQVKARLEALLAKQAETPAQDDSDNERYSLTSLVKRTVSAYARIAHLGNDTNAADALQTLGRVHDAIAPRNRSEVIRAMSYVGEGHPALAREVMNSVLKYNAQLPEYLRADSDMLIALARSSSALAAEVAHGFRDQLVSEKGKREGSRALTELVRAQPDASPYVIADMNALLGGPHTAAAASVLADVAWTQPARTKEILQQFATLVNNGTPSFVGSDIWSTLVSLTERQPDQKPAVQSMLQSYLRQLTTSGDVAVNAPRIVQVSGWLAQLSKR